MTIDEARQNIGAKVLYHPFTSDDEDRARRTETGVITGISSNNAFVHVRYGDDGWSKSTHPACLELVSDD